MRVGLDIGGTKVSAVMFSEEGRVLGTSWHEHRARGIPAVAAELSDVALRLGEGAVNAPVGVSVSGLVRRDGEVTGGASLGISGDLAGAISARVGQPVHVFNDAEATLRSVLGAHRADVGGDVHDAVLLTIGTGIGGAIISDGRPVRGSSGLATELGHLPVRSPGPDACVCGSSGCLEQYAGGKGIADRARALAAAGGSSLLPGLRADSAAEITTKHVVAAAHAGDETALTLLDEAAESCARAIRALCVTIEPDIVFLGGTVAHAASDILPPRIRAHLAAAWPFADLTSPPPVQLDAIGPFAGAIGAALLARDLIDPDSPEFPIDIALKGIEK